MIDYSLYITGEHDEIHVVKLFGHADNVSSRFLLDCLEGLIDEGARSIVLDCTGLEFISSTGLAALVRFSSRLKKAGGSLVLVEVPGLFAQIMRITQLNRLMQIYPSVEEAVEAVSDRVAVC